MKNILVRIFAATLLFICLPVSAAGLQYMIIIDAGSTSSRAHIFEYVKSMPLVPIPVIKDIFNQRNPVPLSSFANNPSNAGASLKTILDNAQNVLQTRGVNLSRVPIKVYATAGMRLLPVQQQAAIYANVRSYIQTHYTFSLNPADVQTISGVTEGLYDWLDVNYLLNNFLHPPMTVGSIDMGGASTQIAYATNDTSMPNNEIQLTINHTHYRVFSQSFLGLGQNQALATMTNNSQAESCYPSGYMFNGRTGNFNFGVCSSVYADIIQSNQVAQQILPTQGQQFVAFSGIYFNYHFFNVNQTPSQSALLNQIQSICSLTYAQLQAQYGNDPALPTYCANGTYFNDLLYNTYRLNGSQLIVISQINGNNIDWALGALLYSLL